MVGDWIMVRRRYDELMRGFALAAVTRIKSSNAVLIGVRAWPIVIAGGVTFAESCDGSPHVSKSKSTQTLQTIITS